MADQFFWYIPLVKYLDPEQPLYAIQDPGLDKLEQIPFSSVEEMASFYIKTIRKIQPRGPYLLGGASGGAIISFEMAHQLLNEGEKVSFVGLLDGWIPHPDKLKHLEFFESMMRRQFHELREKFQANGIIRADSLFKLQWQRAQLLEHYKFKCINLKLTLFKAEETISIYQPYESPFNHWESYSTQPILLYSVPGDHETMFQEPDVTILAQKLTTCLEAIHLNKD